MTAPRSYTVALPVTITVADDGTVTYEVDFSEASEGVKEYDPEYVTMYDVDGNEIDLTEEDFNEDRARIEAALQAHYNGGPHLTPTR